MSTYIVKSGDTYSEIAAKKGVSVAALMRANNCTDPKKLQIGAKLAIPNSTASLTPQEETSDVSSFKSYKIQSGDTASQIAQTHGITLTQLQAANPDVNLEDIKAGKRLLIPVSNTAVQQSEQSQQGTTNPINQHLQDAIAETDINKEFSSSPSYDLLGHSVVLQSFLPSTPPVATAQPEAIKTEEKATAEIPTATQPAQANHPKIAEIQQPEEVKQAQSVAEPQTSPEQAQATWDEKKIKQKALKLVFEYAKKKENFEPTAKDCTAGYPTIGYGHKVKKGEKFTRLSKKEAAKLLAKDLQKAYSQVVTALGDSVKNLNEIQLAALVSMAFNSGGDAVANSEYLALIKEGKFDEAQAKMDAVWGNKTDAQGNIVRDENGKPIKEIKNGLLIRRTEEMMMFGDGKLSEAAKARVLELINESFGTKYTSLDDASKKMLAELLALERKKSNTAIQAKQKAAGKKVKNLQPPMTAAENAKLRRLRNIKALFDILKNPPSFKTE